MLISKEDTIPREKFVIGEGLYTNSLLLEVRSTPNLFEIIPAPTPKVSLAFLCLTILLLGCGMAWFLRDKTSSAMVGFIVFFPQ